MTDEQKTKEQLMEELAVLRQNFSQLEKLLSQQQAERAAFAIAQSTLVAQLQTELTHRQQAEAAVQQKQHFVEKILETTPEIIYIYDLIEQRNVYINHRIKEILGYSSCAVQTMKEQVLPNLIHPDDIDRVNTHLKSLPSLQDGEVVEIEYRMKHSDDDWRWLRSRECVFTRNSNGLPVQILGTATDITKRKQSQREIHFQAGLLSAVEQAIIATDLQGEIIYWNRFAETLYGWLAEEVKQKNIVDLISPVTSLEYATEIMSQLQQGESWTGEFIVQHKNGNAFPVLVTDSPIYDEQGTLIGIVGISRDITEQKNAITKLQESEARLKLALEAACMFTWDWDIVNNQITYSNKDNFISKLAPTFSPSTYQTFLNGIHPQDRERVAMEVMNAITQKANYDTEFRVLIDAEEIIWLGSKGQVFYDQSGKAIRMVGVVMDISERQAALRERKQAEIKIHQQATLLDIATDAILVQDLNNQILFWNQSAKRLYGWLEQETIGQNAINLLFNTEESLQLLEKIHAALADKGFWQGEINQITKDGKKIIVESRWTLVRDEQGQPKSFLVSNTDITQKKQIESQFLRAQRLESIGILASGIAHDLNNVLSPILMSLQLLEKNFSDQQTQQLLKILDTNVQRGADLIKQVLSFAKGVSGKLIILQIKHVVAEINHIIQQTFPKSINFTTELPLDLWAVYADPTQLQQVLMNLCINARDAMPYGGSLKIIAANKFIDEISAQSFFEAKVGYYVVISVVDTGIGIAPEILERIFEPFFTTKETGKGTGLGLSTVMGIVKNYGGFINVESSLGQGSQFQVYLPALTTTQQQQQLTQDIELLTGNGESILVVDDELSLQEITQISLADYNYQVLTASNGIEALSEYVKHKDKISAVLMDLMMPEMDGITTIRALQRINPRIKIIATSGLATNEKITEVSSIGIKAFLPKPYTLSELLKILSLVLNENENISD
ncbi:hybrid sensor histidine kinase/response regulator [Anabaena azotica]|nr:PAS domain S-box protein [Anabaena azotica]